MKPQDQGIRLRVRMAVGNVRHAIGPSPFPAPAVREATRDLLQRPEVADVRDVVRQVAVERNDAPSIKAPANKNDHPQSSPSGKSREESIS